MALRLGYKETAAGMIPEDWEVVRLGDCARFRTGPFGSALHKSDYTEDGVPVVNPMHLANGRIEPTRDMTVTERAAAALFEFRFRTGDIVLGRRGDMGRCALVLPEQSGWLCGTGSMIVRCGEAADPAFLQRVLSSARAVAALKDASVGTTMVNLNQGTVSGLAVQCPPLVEQRAIAQALGDVDALLDGLDRLIAKKRDLKLAAMQQLLSGRTRLPAFGGVWMPTRLGALGTFLKGRGVRKDEVVSAGLPCIRYGEIYTHHVDHVRAFHSFISKETAATSQRIYRGDLLFAGSGETADEIGKCVAYLWTDEAYAGSDIVILRLDGSSCAFLGYLMNHFSVVRQKSRLGQGDAVVHISAASLARIQVSLPSIPEQESIAAILSDMDAELAVLEARREKTRLLKQGMMQELLTGRIRLV